MPSTHLTRTVSSGGNRQKWTLSFWIKFDRVKTGSLNIFSSNKVADADYSTLYLDASRLTYYDYDGGTVNRLRTSRLFRDLNAWYHIVVRYDSTHGTANNRIRFYINGSEATDIIDRLNPSQNYNSFVNANTYKVFFGAQDGDNDGTGDRFGGSMSHIHLLDGEDRDASYFGETDSTTGEWKIKTSPTGINYGTNGFFILKDGNSVTDQSGQNNNLTVGAGTLTKTEDCPSNNFCTLNPLMQDISGYASSNSGNLDFQNGNTFGNKITHGAYFGSIGVSSGKFYWEVKMGDTNQLIGIIAMRPTGGNSYLYDDATANGYYGYSDYYYTNGSAGSNGSGDFDNTSNKIYSFALDATNNKLWIGRDGTFVGDPANGTGATWSSLPTGHEWTPVMHSMSTSQNNYAYFNFGNGYFGTTAVSSAGTNASNNGIFEYDVPSGFTALSTKGLNL